SPGVSRATCPWGWGTRAGSPCHTSVGHASADPDRGPLRVVVERSGTGLATRRPGGGRSDCLPHHRRDDGGAVSMEQARQAGLRILFADDEAHLRDLMQLELPRLGHEVTVCPDGTAALRALERGLYDAALLDLRMPGLTGIEVLGQIRQVSPETQVIIL